MYINHIAIWVSDLEAVKDFYVNYFDMTCGEKYHNPSKRFSSYFLSFKNSSARIELMHSEMASPLPADRNIITGLAHFAISTGSKEQVDALTERLRADKYIIKGEPRTTGDGYYESIVKDPEGNLVEITV